MLEKVCGVAASWGRPCLVSKSSWWSVGTGWLAPNSDLWPATIQMRGQWFLARRRLVPSCRFGWWGFTWGYAYLGTCIIDFYMEHMVFYHGMLTLRWNYYGVYGCIPG
jgi:hypothetical protein